MAPQPALPQVTIPSAPGHHSAKAALVAVSRASRQIAVRWSPSRSPRSSKDCWGSSKTWGWVKALVPCREPQVIAGIYGCSSHYSNVSIGIDPYPPDPPQWWGLRSPSGRISGPKFSGRQLWKKMEGKHGRCGHWAEWCQCEASQIAMWNRGWNQGRRCLIDTENRDFKLMHPCIASNQLQTYLYGCWIWSYLIQSCFLMPQQPRNLEPNAPRPGFFLSET